MPAAHLPGWKNAAGAEAAGPPAPPPPSALNSSSTKMASPLPGAFSASGAAAAAAALRFRLPPAAPARPPPPAGAALRPPRKPRDCLSGWLSASAPSRLDCSAALRWMRRACRGRVECAEQGQAARDATSAAAAAPACPCCSRAIANAYRHHTPHIHTKNSPTHRPCPSRTPPPPTHHALLELLELGAQAVHRRRQAVDALLVDGIRLGIGPTGLRVGGEGNVVEGVLLPNAVFLKEGEDVGGVGQAVGLQVRGCVEGGWAGWWGQGAERPGGGRELLSAA
jgi:hypothetical protein